MNSSQYTIGDGVQSMYVWSGEPEGLSIVKDINLIKQMLTEVKLGIKEQ